MQARLTTRQEVLDTIRAYHTTVIRSEIQNVVLQVEGIIKQLDDKLLRTHDNLQWLASESRQDQKKLSALQAITTGWSPEMSAEDRLFMLGWMFEQVEYFRTWLLQCAYNISGNDSPYVWLNVLQRDPTTPPAGDKHSVATILTFKSWDLRQQFMTAFGVPSGTPLWRDSRTHVKGRHVRVTPATPQFQRRLEVPIRVLLSLINESETLESNQVMVLWKTLTIMKPQQAREFDEQAEAVARMHYYSSEGILRGRLEVTPESAAAIRHSRRLVQPSRTVGSTTGAVLYTEYNTSWIWPTKHSLTWLCSLPKAVAQACLSASKTGTGVHPLSTPPQTIRSQWR